LEPDRANMGSYNFEAQYQQRPMPPEGNLVKLDWFRRYETPPDRADFDYVLQSWDTAGSLDALASYSACTTWGVLGRAYYLLDVVRERLEYPELRRRVIAEAQKYRADRVLIEYAGSGQYLVQELSREGRLPVRSVRPKGDKRSRMDGQTAKMEAGQVHIPEEAPWL
jgi:predicted phage terminase large subunit-like protein